MKSYVKELSLVVAHLFRDATATFPALSSEFDRDQARLRVLVESRGIHVLVEDLPTLAKHLDRCLASKRYTLLEGCHVSGLVSRRIKVPKFLRGLYLCVFDENAILKEDYNVEAVYFLRQILAVGSKAALDCSVKHVRTEVRDMLSVDGNLPRPESFWSKAGVTALSITETFRGFSKCRRYRRAGRRIDSANENVRRGNSAAERKEELSENSIRPPCSKKSPRLSGSSTLMGNLDSVSRLLVRALGDFVPGDLEFKHGPGAVSDLASRANKYCWRTWSERLESVFPIADYGFHSYSAWASHCRATAPESGGGSEEPIACDEGVAKLVSVRKTYKKPRLIASEPCANQWCQQAIWHWMKSRTHSSWIRGFVRFDDQSLNQDLCVRGSTDGSLCTVDLSSASDRVSCKAVGNLFRSNQPLLLALQATRTRFLRQDLDSLSPEITELRKYSTMGNATTFPVESLLFLTIAISACLTARSEKVTEESIRNLIGKVAVFGDDIIVPSDCRELLFDLLEILDFKVNQRKSFWSGNFRESCGVDSINGVNITPVKWMKPNDGKPDGIASTVAVANNFYKKFLLHTAAYLTSTVQRHRVTLVPISSGAFGLQSFATPPLRDIPSRWSEEYQRTEYLVTTLIGSCPRTPIENDSALLQYFTEAPDPYVVWRGGVPQRPKLRMKRRWVPLQAIR